MAASALRRLDKLLVERGLASSREAAKELIVAGRVKVSGFVQNKPASMAVPDVSLEVSDPPGGDARWVSRGAHKLIKALDVWAVDPSGCDCIDIGASTGGFTQVLLARGAARVAAVDVGYGQLAWTLRNDPRVRVLERTNARYVTQEDIGWPGDILTVDASFISLRLLLPNLQNLVREDGMIMALVKPQFEVGRAQVGKGVVRDPALHAAVLTELAAFAAVETRMSLLDATYSPIKGPEGNIEFIFYLKRLSERRSLLQAADFERIVTSAHENWGGI